MISHLLETIFKLQHLDSFESTLGAPRGNPWTRFIAHAAQAEPRGHRSPARSVGVVRQPPTERWLELVGRFRTSRTPGPPKPVGWCPILRTVRDLSCQLSKTAER